MNANPYQSPAEATATEANPASLLRAVARIALSIAMLVLGVAVPCVAALATCWYTFPSDFGFMQGFVVFWVVLFGELWVLKQLFKVIGYV